MHHFLSTQLGVSGPGDYMDGFVRPSVLPLQPGIVEEGDEVSRYQIVRHNKYYCVMLSLSLHGSV